MAKLQSTDLAWRIIDEAVQLHGGAHWWGSPALRTRSDASVVPVRKGAGYMLEYPVARNLADSRVPRIYGGSNEIMKELIARTCKVFN